jgi:RimJ/RimL family protein N-acetyltransferase
VGSNQGQHVVTYRQLPEAEWPRLREAYAGLGGEVPSADLKTAVVAEFEGKIIGLTGIDLVVHAGPRWVAPHWRRRGIALEMGRKVDEVLKAGGAEGYLVFPSNPASEGLCQRLGLEKLPWSVYKRMF